MSPINPNIKYHLILCLCHLLLLKAIIYLFILFVCLFIYVFLWTYSFSLYSYIVAHSFTYIVTKILSKSHSRAASKWKKIHIYDKDRVYIQLNSYSHSVLLHNIASLYVFFLFSK